MDSMEEFNFKPINEGLGFHRKKVELKEEMKSAKVAKEVFPKTPPPRPQENAQRLNTPLPSKIVPRAPSKDIIDQVARSFKKPNETFIEKEAPPTIEPFIKVEENLAKAKKTISREAQPWMISPFFVDAILVLALGLTCLLITLLVTRADLVKLIATAQGDYGFWLTFPVLGLGMVFIYMTLTRLFLGASLGELVFDLQIGTDEERSAPHYAFQVVFRTLLAILSGLFVLPLLSLMAKNDYLGQITGLKLYLKKR